MRRSARELALQILFQTEFHPQINLHQLMGLYEENFPQDTVEYAEVIIEGVQLHKTEIDDWIRNRSQNWKIDRMALVDKNILRISLYEMKWADEKIKPAISINEAVEIAKKFSSEESPHFINGVLDQMARELA